MIRERILIPAGIGSGDNVGGDVGDVVVRKAAAEGGHGVLAVGDLGHNGLLVEATGEELLDGGLLEGVVGHNGVLAAGVAGSAVGVEDLLASASVTGEGGGGDKEGSTGDGDLGGVGLGGHLDGAGLAEGGGAHGCEGGGGAGEGEDSE